MIMMAVIFTKYRCFTLFIYGNGGKEKKSRKITKMCSNYFVSFLKFGNFVTCFRRIQITQNVRSFKSHLKDLTLNILNELACIITNEHSKFSFDLKAAKIFLPFLEKRNGTNIPAWTKCKPSLMFILGKCNRFKML